MPLRFVTKTIHAYLDYPVAIALIGLPFLLGLGDSSSLAFWLSIGIGAAAFVLTLLTDHHLGVLRVLPYGLHLAVDGVVGLVFLAAPFFLGFGGLDAIYYWVNGAAVVAVVSLDQSENTVATV
jgi:hypothetical protein